VRGDQVIAVRGKRLLVAFTGVRFLAIFAICLNEPISHLGKEGEAQERKKEERVRAGGTEMGKEGKWFMKNWKGKRRGGEKKIASDSRGDRPFNFSLCSNKRNLYSLHAFSSLFRAKKRTSPFRQNFTSFFALTPICGCAYEKKSYP